MELLKVEGLKKSFDKTEVLKGVDFTLGRGEVLAIIGSSGSGKTTLLRCLNFLEAPNGGRITVGDHVVYDGDDKKRKSAKEKRENQLKFGLVFQSFNLFPQYTVHKNITLAATLALKSAAKKEKMSSAERALALEAIEKKADELLSQVGLSEKRDSYPCQLSGGQCQRVAIARALALGPEILCFDEPTSALDPELTGEVLRAIKSLKGDDRTMIIVTHEMDFARHVADKVIFMADGVIEEVGEPEELFSNPKSPKLRAFLQKDDI
ncbi:MAG: amino acid ABC transporter ATP-binding protein [Ruminococcaceae bacterium]|nr:amino acid ABC transporter ATP-binding protein [Oscillospiraceae bacterium]